MTNSRSSRCHLDGSRFNDNKQNKSQRWLILENMNTVLDDNKKLCLNSGESDSIGKNYKFNL